MQYTHLASRARLKLSLRKYSCEVATASEKYLFRATDYRQVNHRSTWQVLVVHFPHDIADRSVQSRARCVSFLPGEDIDTFIQIPPPSLAILLIVRCNVGGDRAVLIAPEVRLE